MTKIEPIVIFTGQASQTYCSLTCALINKCGDRWQLMSGYKG